MANAIKTGFMQVENRMISDANGYYLYEVARIEDKRLK